MGKEDFEFSNIQVKKALNIGVGIFAVFLFIKTFLIDTDKKRIDNSLKNIKEESFDGLVIDKGFDKFNHNASVIYFKDKTKVALFGQFWAQINIGDSLIKKKGETIITVYRNKEKFILDNKEIMDSWRK
ncbi:hypothetical protein [Flavobacterium phragmitis]|nr:hypothetical protein [Flavobacterium phragmitis]